MTILVLGGGLVGNTIAKDLLAENVEVTIADLHPDSLKGLENSPEISIIALDVTDEMALTKTVQPYDLIIGAVPGFLGFKMLENVIKAGKSIVDISFSPEDPLVLHDLAVEKGVTAIIDAGVSPGLANLILGRFYEEYELIDRFTQYVGGLPEERHWPFEYMSVFSPIDVIEEYTRPARMKSGGKMVVRPALSDVEIIDFPLVGSLEAFSTDGLRTLLTTLPIPYMKEKTLRYPGHADRMRMMKEAGFFDTEPIDVNGAQVVPRDLTAKLLFDAWKPKGNGKDITVLRVEMEGILNGVETTTIVDLYDVYDTSTGTTAMARTTGFTCSSSARLLIDGIYNVPGVHPLEHVGSNEAAYQSVLKDLSDRNMYLQIQQFEGPSYLR